MSTKTTDPKTNVPKSAEKRRRPMLRFALWTFIGTAGAWLAGTESGRSAALHLAVRFVPGFEAQAISGPWDDLTVKGIGWMSAGISAKIDELHLGWDWRALFEHSLHVTKLEVVGADIKVDTTALPASKDVPADDAAGTKGHGARPAGSAPAVFRHSGAGGAPADQDRDRRSAADGG